MALVNFRWFSRVLEKQVETQVLLPEHHPERCATFYLLHGLSDDSTTWLRRTRIETDIAGLPLIVVMPDGFRGFYTDNERGPAYGQYIGEELISVIDRVFPTTAHRSKRAIGGLSMGGYGALRTALAYPEKFISANSHSGAIAAGHVEGQRPHTPRGLMLDDIFGPTPHGSRHDIVALAAAAKVSGILPRMLIDCGTEDFLWEDNVTITAALRQAGIPHEFRKFSGGHDWDYWAEHIPDAIAFHADAMNVKRPAV